MRIAIGLLIALTVYLLMPASPGPRLRSIVAPGGARTSPDGVAAVLRIHARTRRARRARDDAALAALVGLAAELRAGLPPRQALVQASTSVWPTAVAAVRLDGDIAAALRRDAGHTPVLRALAACWEAGAATGSGLADSVDRLAASHRAAEEIRGELEVQLAGPRSTARMLGGLPLIGIALGALLGADPLGFLLGSAVGVTCLVSGVALTVLGMWWTNRIAANVEARL